MLSIIFGIAALFTNPGYPPEFTDGIMAADLIARPEFIGLEWASADGDERNYAGLSGGLLITGP